MRFAELVEREESYSQELRDDAINLLIAAQAQGVRTIEPQQLMKSLTDLGHTLGLESLIDLLQDHPLIQKITPQEIVVSTGDEYYADAKTKADDEDKISKMAQRQIDKDMK
jgi:hypothetical protein